MITVGGKPYGSENNRMVARRYLREKRGSFVLLLVCTAIFFIVFLLCHLPLACVAYAGSLCGSILFVYGCADFYRYREQHRMRLAEKGSVEYGIESVREGDSLLEEDYKDRLLWLYDRKNEIISEKDRQYEDLKTYVTIWSHQIKTPITAMNLLLQNPDRLRPEEIRKELFEIESYVDTTLQYMRLDSLHMDFAFKECSVEDMVKQVVKYYARVFIGKKLALRLGQMDVKVVTDEKWMVFVLRQILSNALKYTKEGTISICAQEHQDGNYRRTVLMIEDTGQGIAKEDLPRIFEKAFTGYNGHMDKKATGIGLFLTKQVLDKLGHKIIVTSEAGHGTKVRIICEN